MTEGMTCTNRNVFSVTSWVCGGALTFGGGAERELRVVLVGETLYQVDLFEGELYRVPVLRVARHVRGPELPTKDHFDI